MEKLFKKLTKGSLEPETQCSVLPTLAEVIKLRDTSMMALEISVSSTTCDRLTSLADAQWACDAIFASCKRSSRPGRFRDEPNKRLCGRLVTNELMQNRNFSKKDPFLSCFALHVKHPFTLCMFSIKVSFQTFTRRWVSLFKRSYSLF